MDLITEQRLARRAAILETARQMIAEVGYETVTVRDLARRCRVSVPTLYNQFGGKDQLLGAAVEEHFLGVLNAAEPDRDGGGFERLQRIVAQCAEQLLALPAYHQRLLKAFASLDQTTAVQLRIAQRLTDVFGKELAAMRSAGRLEELVATELVAEQLTTGCISAAMVWSSGLLPDRHLMTSMRYASGLVLAGIVRGRVASVVKSQLKDSQRELSRVHSDRASKLKRLGNIS